jgi:hypothetical protein
MSKCNIRNTLRVRELVAYRNNAYAQVSVPRAMPKTISAVAHKFTGTYELKSCAWETKAGEKKFGKKNCKVWSHAVATRA